LQSFYSPAEARSAKVEIPGAKIRLAYEIHEQKIYVSARLPS
jgi:hypothetical protein